MARRGMPHITVVHRTAMLRGQAKHMLLDTIVAMRKLHARQWWGVEIDGTRESFTKARLRYEPMAGPKERLP